MRYAQFFGVTTTYAGSLEVVEDAECCGTIWLEVAVRPRLHGAKFGGGTGKSLDPAG